METGGPSASQKTTHSHSVSLQTPKEIGAATVMEYDFVERPSEEFFCPVTTELLLQPYQTDCCGHLLSKKAVMRLEQENKPCPVCNVPNLSTRLDKNFRRRGGDVKVFCPHGCEWVGEIRDLNRHTCPRFHVTQPPGLEQYEVLA